MSTVRQMNCYLLLLDYQHGIIIPCSTPLFEFDDVIKLSSHPSLRSYSHVYEHITATVSDALTHDYMIGIYTKWYVRFRSMLYPEPTDIRQWEYIRRPDPTTCIPFEATDFEDEDDVSLGHLDTIIDQREVYGFDGDIEDDPEDMPHHIYYDTLDDTHVWIDWGKPKYDHVFESGINEMKENAGHVVRHPYTLTRAFKFRWRFEDTCEIKTYVISALMHSHITDEIYNKLSDRCKYYLSDILHTSKSIGKSVNYTVKGSSIVRRIARHDNNTYLTCNLEGGDDFDINTILYKWLSFKYMLYKVTRSGESNLVKTLNANISDVSRMIGTYYG